MSSKSKFRSSGSMNIPDPAPSADAYGGGGGAAAARDSDESDEEDLPMYLRRKKNLPHAPKMKRDGTGAAAEHREKARSQFDKLLTRKQREKREKQRAAAAAEEAAAAAAATAAKQGGEPTEAKGAGNGGGAKDLVQSIGKATMAMLIKLIVADAAETSDAAIAPSPEAVEEDIRSMVERMHAYETAAQGGGDKKKKKKNKNKKGAAPPPQPEAVETAVTTLRTMLLCLNVKRYRGSSWARERRERREQQRGAKK